MSNSQTTRKVALFVPCFVDQVMPQVAIDTLTVLRRIGCEVVFPEDQTCCGQPGFNTGHWESALPCAEHFVRVFSGYEAIVCPSGSCTSMVRKHYPELLESSPLREDAIAVGQRVFEFAEFLVRVAGVTDVGASFPHAVAYHPSCHGTRELGIYDEPMQLLRAVRDIDLRPLPNEGECCGFGGMFSTKFGMISAAMGDTKAGNIEQTGAEYVTTIDPSCLMHLDGVFGATKRKLKTIYLAGILASSSAGAASANRTAGAKESR
jgi:L-lactate dehydrogenase complex protein LldE